MKATEKNEIVAALLKMEETLSKMEERLSKMEGMLDSTVTRTESLEESTRRRLRSLEKRVDATVSPPRLSSTSFEGLGGLFTVGPGLKQTEDAVRRLSRTSGWVSVENVAEETKRSEPTESAYLKVLARTGRIDRKPVYEGTGSNRRVRKYVYTLRDTH